MLSIENLTYRIGNRTLFDGASARVAAGHKVALVGRNGYGKTTLMKLLLGELHAQGGEISMNRRARVGTVAQEAPDGDESLLETVLAADRERVQLLEQAETEHDTEKLAEVHERLLAIDAYRAPARAAIILAGLGFDDKAQAQPCKSFSGGWRMRVALASALATQPDLLLLDEPTNHLDLEAALWLEGFLKTYPATILMISHDRGLLNAVPEIILHVDQLKLKAYKGNYDSFERQRAESMRHLAASASKQAAAREHMEAFVARFRAKASKARQAQSRLKALQKMPPISIPLEESAVEFQFPQPSELSPPLLVLDQVDAGYGTKTILHKLDLRIDGDDRIALLGVNGNGKSTFLKLLSGAIQAQSGRIQKSSKLKIGYFAQHQSEAFDMEKSMLAEAKSWMKSLTEEKVRAHLGRFGFSGARVETKIGNLSGGEKARLLLALITKDAPHILLLDEPTNHLDIDSREALLKAINEYEGAVILVTHDLHLVELTADRLWLVADGTVKPFEGDLDDYTRYLAQERKTALADGKPPKPEKAEKVKSSVRKPGALKQILKQAEADMARLKGEIAALEKQIAAPDFYRKTSDVISGARRGLTEAQEKLAAAETSWLEATAEL
jgi:ATP-binding cassette subfamily F protein 3